MFRRCAIVFAVGIETDADFQTAPVGDEEKTLDLSVHIELILAAVADVHFQFARLHIIQIEHLDGIVADDGRQRLGIVSAI